MHAVLRVPLVAARGPGKFIGDRSKEEIESIGIQDVIVDVHEDHDYHDRVTNA